MPILMPSARLWEYANALSLLCVSYTSLCAASIMLATNRATPSLSHQFRASVCIWLIPRCSEDPGKEG
jgi:hypothetical protein